MVVTGNILGTVDGQLQKNRYFCGMINQQEIDRYRGEGVCVYGASSSHIDPTYVEAAREVGHLIGRSGRPLVNGAGRGGLMAAATDGALEADGVTIGVIPQFMLDRGWQHPHMTHIVATPDMHRRKETMARLSYAAIALPGGYGTFEELLEIITWRQLRLFAGNVVILNTGRYYDPLLDMFAKATYQGFISDSKGQPWSVATTPAEAVRQALAQHCTDDPGTILSKY